MHTSQVDNQLQQGIEALCAARWGEAREVLGRRLGSTRQLGGRRLNLFLLSVAAASAGQNDVAKQLLDQAQASPEELGDPRHFEVANPQDSAQELCRQLQAGWWEFNDWGSPCEPRPAQPKESSLTVDWLQVLQDAVAGQGRELDQMFTPLFESGHPYAPYLWNLVALAYLQEGDLRTHQEMSGSGRFPIAPHALPDELEQTLLRWGLEAAVECWSRGEPLTPRHLESSASTRQARQTPVPDSRWQAVMATGFEQLREGEPTLAARTFGALSSENLDPQRAVFTENALALALFRAGDYGESERSLEEFQALRERLGGAPDPELSQRYRQWLDSVAAPVDPADPPFGAPFSKSLHQQPQRDPVAPPHPTLDFWRELETALASLGRREVSRAREGLRDILAADAGLSRTENFLAHLCWTGISVLVGDHVEAQESQGELVKIFQSGPLEDSDLQRAGAIFRSMGADTLAGKLLDPDSGGVDPWSDFPADFAV